MFQSTLPARGATSVGLFALPRNCVSIHAPRAGSDLLISSIVGVESSFNPRSPRGERHEAKHEYRVNGVVSIHAPRAGSDMPRGLRWTGWPCFNPRSPRGERRRLKLDGQEVWFQSTLPARGATNPGWRASVVAKFQSTLPARGATAPTGSPLKFTVFQSTLPARGATLIE